MSETVDNPGNGKGSQDNLENEAGATEKADSKTGTPERAADNPGGVIAGGGGQSDLPAQGGESLET